ncbi:MAG TPA: segregation/condensation protein A [Thermoanaerobaculia bacterium]|nr:segregation/condensation protein A [Thermoanaerobaculia bacterium]
MNETGDESTRPEAGERATAATDPGASLDEFRRTHRSMLPESWLVRLPVFEGPLDLLLHLIRVNRVEITDIPVALICDQYHAYLELMEELDLDVAGEYIYEAALLIQLKSRMLLPQPRVEPGEEPPEDPRQELVRRLLEYQKIKEAAQTLAEVDALRRGVWTRIPQSLAAVAEDEEMDLGDLSLFDLLTTFRRVLDRYDREHPEPMVLHGEIFAVRDQIDRLLGRLAPGRPLSLLDDLLALSCRAEAIAAFLAILELGRLQLVRLHQLTGGDILLHRTERELVAEELEEIGG